MDKVDNFVRIPYTTNPGMQRYTGIPFRQNPNLDVIKQKHQELDRWGQDLYGENDACIENRLVQRAAEVCQINAVDNVVDLALQFEEDVAIMHRGVLAAICFCFPSSWIPRTRVGQPLSAIHEAVADGELLVRSSSRIAETMAINGPFRRSVWTISNSGDLNQHPQNKSDLVPQSISDLYFRTEIQTTMPLGDGVSSMFFVRVQTCPLSDVWPDLGDNILASINSMTDAVLDYKNLRGIKNLLNTACCGYGV